MFLRSHWQSIGHSNRNLGQCRIKSGAIATPITAPVVAIAEAIAVAVAEVVAVAVVITAVGQAVAGKLSCI